MAKAVDPNLEKYIRFDAMLRSPKGFWQKCFKFCFFAVGFLILGPIAWIYPFSVGADTGRMGKIQRKKGFRAAADFGLKRLPTYLAKLNRGRRFFKGYYGLKRELTWLFFNATVDYAYWDPRPEDETTFSAIAETLGTDSVGHESSETFCAMARLTWKLGKQEEAWFWTERAVIADDANADAHHLKGWYGALLDRGNPVDSLFRAVTIDPELLRDMRKDETLARFPEFMPALEARAKQAGILVV